MVKKTTTKKAKTATKKAVKKATKKATSKKAAPAKVNSAPKKKAVTKAKKTKLTERETVIHVIKQDLLSQRGSLLKEAEETLSTLPSDLNFPDMGDQATAETDRNFILRLRTENVCS